jgi:hypothetical protein
MFHIVKIKIITGVYVSLVDGLGFVFELIGGGE